VKYKKRYFLHSKDAELFGSFRRLFFRTLLLTTIFFIAIFIINHYQKKAILANQLVAHTKDVIYQSEKTISLVKDYETSARGFVISGNEDFLAPGIAAKDSIGTALIQLRKVVSDNLAQQATVDSLAYFVNKRIEISDEGIVLRKYKSLQAALAFVSNGSGKKCMDTIRALQALIQLREKNVLANRNYENNKAAIVYRAILISILVAFFIMLIILFWQAWHNLNEYQIRQKEINMLLRQLATSLIHAQKIAHLGSWEWNIENNEEQWSDELYRIFGYEPGSITINHHTFINAIHPYDKEMVDKTIANTIEKKQPYNIQFRIILPNGMVKYVHARGELSNNQQQPMIMTGTLQDITERVLKDKEKDHLSIILEKTNKVARVGWWEVDVKLGKIKWSSVIKDIMEVPKDYEPGAINYDSFIKDDASKKMLEQAFADAILFGNPYDITLSFITAKGNTIMARSVGQAQFEDGECVSVFGILQQVNMQKIFSSN
jgi:PAS domain S-box-containing protein